MAIYHFSVQVASRSTGRSAVAMAAYRSGERLEDERTGELKHYKREAQPETVILAPAQSPEWVHDRNRLWNEVEKSEKRKDAQLCREINIALPKEFSDRLQVEELKTFCKREFVDRGMVVDIAIHRDDANNPHAHVMLTMREIGPSGFGHKVREWNDRKLLDNWREQWALQVNRIFERYNRPERIDHRSFERQGIKDRMPTIHEGPTVREMEQRGKSTDRGMINKAVAAHNGVVVELEAYRKERTELQRMFTSQEPKSYEQIWEDRQAAFRRLEQARGMILQLGEEIKRIEGLKQLQQEEENILAELKQLKPKKLTDRFFSPNSERIQILEKRLLHIQSRIKGEKPKIEKMDALQAELAGVQGTFYALEKVFKEADSEFNHMKEERIREHLHKRQRNKERDRGQEKER